MLPNKNMGHCEERHSHAGSPRRSNLATTLTNPPTVIARSKGMPCAQSCDKAISRPYGHNLATTLTQSTYASLRGAKESLVCSCDKAISGPYVLARCSNVSHVISRLLCRSPRSQPPFAPRNDVTCSVSYQCYCEIIPLRCMRKVARAAGRTGFVACYAAPR